MSTPFPRVRSAQRNFIFTVCVCVWGVTDPGRLQTCLPKIRASLRYKFFLSCYQNTMWVPGPEKQTDTTTTVPVQQSGRLPSLQSSVGHQAKSQSDEVVGNSGAGSQAMPSLHPARPGVPLSRHTLDTGESIHPAEPFQGKTSGRSFQKPRSTEIKRTKY